MNQESNSIRSGPVEFSIKSGAPQTGANGCLVGGVYEAAQALRRGRGPRRRVPRLPRRRRAPRRHARASPARRCCCTNVPGVAAERVLLVGLGRARDFRDKRYREAVAAAVRRAERDRRRGGHAPSHRARSRPARRGMESRARRDGGERRRLPLHAHEEQERGRAARRCAGSRSPSTAPRAKRPPPDSSRGSPLRTA